MENPEIWEKPEKAQSLGKERARLHEVVSTLDALSSGLRDNLELLEMAVAEDDDETVSSITDELDELTRRLEAMEFQRMFSGDLDASNAFLEIQSGSGGTEAQDWSNMLLRMYLRWGEAHGFTTEIIELSAGEVAHH